MAGRPHTLKGLRVHEVSLVDVPANPGAQHVLFKRRVEMEKTQGDGPLDRLLARLGLKKSAGASDEIDPAKYADDAGKVVDDATDALGKSIATILADEAVTDKPGAIAKSLAEFRGYVDEHTTGVIEKAMRDVATVIGKDRDMPTLEEVQAQNAALAKQLADAQEEVAKAKMTAEQRAKFDAMTPEQKKQYLAASEEDRMKMLVTKSADPEADTRLTKALQETEDLRKRLAVFEQERELTTFAKRARDAGLGEDQADTLMKASKGDPEAFGKMLDMIKSATAAARTGGVFKEFGGTGPGVPGGGEARAEVEAQAQTLVKADPKLSLIAARVQVRKSNPDLAQRERDEERAAVRAVV